jgi:putative SOS response-associated peptidase YedK
MPVLIGHNAVGAWLSPDTDAETLKALLEPYSDKMMQAWIVAANVNNARNKDKTCGNKLGGKPLILEE